MPLAPVKIPLYPDVPPDPGVPGIFRSPVATGFEKALLLVADVATVAQWFSGPQWGLFTDGGAPLVIPDTVESVDFRREARISDYPVESGAFQSYDKVLLPYDARVSMTCDGTSMDKTLFLANIDQASQSLDLFTLVTPDGVYSNLNIIHYSYERKRERGATIVHVDIWLQQIVQTATTQFTNTNQAAPDTTNAQQPTGVPDVSNGTVQTTAPPAALPVPPIPPLSGGAAPAVLPFD